jgi:UDP-N-acetylglucosamine 2-epimerase (non-hydrolysing)
MNPSMKIVSIVGARPQFIKCAPLSRQLRQENREVIVHTGQHYDPAMSDIFFTQLAIPRPDYNLDIGSGTHGKQTGKMLEELEEIIFLENPERVVVFGDTNSTLAGALAAVKLHIPVAHVEAGLRSFDRRMPEEINRVLTDHISDLLFCPTHTAVDNLAREGITKGVYLVGDIMVDALDYNRKIAEEKSGILEMNGLTDHEYLVLTVHRPSNTDLRENLENIISAVGESGRTTVFPVHPRTRKYLEEYGMWDSRPSNIFFTEPLGYPDMLRLMAHAEKILTDSGGIQKEAYILGVPCITLRDTTEWVETLDGGWNVLAGTRPGKILREITQPRPVSLPGIGCFGDGHTAETICRIIQHSWE